MMRSLDTRASSKNTSQKFEVPFICRSGRTSTPGWSMSIAKYVMPACFGTSTLVRASGVQPDERHGRGGPNTGGIRADENAADRPLDVAQRAERRLTAH